MIITVDGQSSSGKSSLSACLADALGFHFLGSGAMYRSLAYLMLQEGEDNLNLVEEIQGKLRFAYQEKEVRVFLGQQDITKAISQVEVAKKASLIAKNKAVRQALVPIQHAFYQPPGLVAEGRDMGSVIFPDAAVKFFLTTPIAIRAKRRQAQLQALGQDKSLEEIMEALAARDHQDTTRSLSPLKAVTGAMIIDTGTSWQHSFSRMLSHVKQLMK